MCASSPMRACRKGEGGRRARHGFLESRGRLDDLFVVGGGGQRLRLGSTHRWQQTTDIYIRTSRRLTSSRQEERREKGRHSFSFFLFRRCTLTVTEVGRQPHLAAGKFFFGRPLAKRNVYIHRELLHNRASASKLTHLRTPDLRGATATAMIRPDRECSGLFMDMVTTASAGFARRPVEAIALSSQPVLPFNEAA